MKKTTLLICFVLLLVQPAQASANDTFYGVEVARLSNYTTTNNQVFPFDVVRFGLTSMWDSNDPTKILIPIDGVWMVGTEVTTLGLNYAYLGGLDNSRVILEIVKNWNGNESTTPHLFADICATRFEPQQFYGANLNSMNCPVVLKQGDYLQLLVTGKGRLLVESNPLDSGLMSPHFYAYYLGALP